MESRDKNIHTGIPDELREKQREIHDFMMEQAEKDYERKTGGKVESEEEANRRFLDMVRARSQVKAEERKEKGLLDIVRDYKKGHI